MDSGTRFAKVASAALDALVPGPGSFANLTIVGHFPIYSVGAMTVFFEPSLLLQAARTAKGKLEATIELVLGLKAEAGASGDTWWSTLLAYLKAYVKGSIKIVADNAAEVFNHSCSRYGWP
ncbi:MAG: hypothetical protein V4850_04445 [Myxococcota bacterium]